MDSEALDKLEALPDAPFKFFLLGMLLGDLMRIEAANTFNTGDRGRMCRTEKADQARTQIERIRGIMATASAKG